MTICTGTLAEQCALPYVEGTLPEFEAERFEEHYFNCPACLAHLEALQAVARELGRHPIEVPAGAAARTPFGWPSRVWALGAVAALLVVGVFTYRMVVNQGAQPAVAHSTPAPAPVATPAAAQAAPAAARASQLADLAMPAFVASSLRGASQDAHFEAGMNAYLKDNCRAAVADLAQVPAAAREARAAQFYLGVCQMHVGRRSAAAAALGSVAQAGDSPQQEAALYYMAQIALVNNDPARAHGYLRQTIALSGDLRARARAQDSQVKALIGRSDDGKASVR